jgi:hypothetical protein
MNDVADQMHPGDLSAEAALLARFVAIGNGSAAAVARAA